MKNKQAFTLIELLVVVLIIGILAAVALPQYQKAVVKSRVSTILPVLQTIVSAEEAYYLANGDYARVSALDVEMPSSCTPTSEIGGNWICGKDFHVTPRSWGGAMASYCPGYNENIHTCIAHRDFYIRFGFAYCQRTGSESNCERTDASYLPNERLCVVTNNSSLGEKVCSGLAGFEKLNT